MAWNLQLYEQQIDWLVNLYIFHPEFWHDLSAQDQRILQEVFFVNVTDSEVTLLEPYRRRWEAEHPIEAKRIPGLIIDIADHFGIAERHRDFLEP